MTWDNDRECYTVRVVANGKRMRLGRYETAEEAYEDYKRRIGGLHGEFANAG